jgi:hypothetical protein
LIVVITTERRMSPRSNPEEVPMQGQHTTEQSAVTNLDFNARAAAEAALSAAPPPPPRPTDTSATALLTHWRAVDTWLVNDIHGDDATDAGANLRAQVEDELVLAPLRSWEDAQAKIEFLRIQDRRWDGELSDWAGPILAQIATFLPSGTSSSSENSSKLADAELIACARACEPLGTRLTAIDDADADAIVCAADPFVQRSKELRATTMAGLRAKAAIANHFIPQEDSDEYTDLEWQLCHSLVQDLLAVPALDGDKPLHDMLVEHQRLWDAAEAAPINTARQEKANDRRWSRLGDLREKIADYSPLTRAGLQAKAELVLRWARYHTSSKDPRHLDLQAGGDYLPVSVVQDVVRFCGRADRDALIAPQRVAAE